MYAYCDCDFIFINWGLVQHSRAVPRVANVFVPSLARRRPGAGRPWTETETSYRVIAAPVLLVRLLVAAGVSI